MTLILGISASNAICMSVDYQVTDSRTRVTIDPAAVKTLRLQVGFEEDALKVLIGYAGLAQLWGEMPTGRWLREVLRGPNQSFDELMQHLLAQLNLKITPFGQPLIIRILAIGGKNGEWRYLGGFSNLGPGCTQNAKFAYEMLQIGVGPYFAHGSGAAVVEAGGYLDALRAHVAIPDHSTEEHMRLLATINRQVAEVESTVSPYCNVTCVGAENQWVPQSQAFLEKGETVPFSAPFIFNGIDLTYMAEEGAKFAMDSTPPDFNEKRMQRELKRRDS
ncbi:hypothetical protein ONA92_24185 [Mycobacteroides salmoniphilum]|uniref:hypothetical protein n=1 Tax=Mycobacteroides salmoniphilum TaxID=404941 RepID=UPI003562CC2A